MWNSIFPWLKLSGLSLELLLPESQHSYSVIAAGGEAITETVHMPQSTTTHVH